MKKLISFSIFLTSYLRIFISPAFAQDVVGQITAPGTVVDDPSLVGKFISTIIVFITVVAGLYAFIQLILGGFGYITSAGDKGKVQESTQRMLYAIIGLVTIGASFIISSIVGKLVFGPGFNILSPSLQTVTP